MAIQRHEVLLNKLHEFAMKYKDTPHASEVLMSFLRGECQHLPDSKGKCLLCGFKGN